MAFDFLLSPERDKWGEGIPFTVCEEKPFLYSRKRKPLPSSVHHQEEESPLSLFKAPFFCGARRPLFDPSLRLLVFWRESEGSDDAASPPLRKWRWLFWVVKGLLAAADKFANLKTFCANG